MEDGDTMHLAERQLETSNNQENSQNTNDIPSNNFHNLSFLQNENERLFIPNALTNISDYINEMEQFLQRHIDFWNDNQSSADWMQLGAHNLPNIDDASTSNHLSFILNRTKQLLRNNVAMDISNLSMYLRRIDSSSNPVLRSYIQYESGRLGATLHQLGAMLLEVGRVTMCLRMGETPEESLVYPGRAAYISRSGPNSSLILLSPLLSIWAWRINQIATMRPQSVPVQLASQVRGSTAGRGDQHHEPGSQRVSPEEAESVQAFGTQSHLATSRSVEQQASNLDRENSYETFASLSASVAARIVTSMQYVDSVDRIRNIMQSPAFNRLLSSIVSRRGDLTESLRRILEPIILSLASQNSSHQLVQQRRMNSTRTIQLISEVSRDVSRILTDRQPEPSDVMTPIAESWLDCNYQVNFGQVVQRIEQNSDSRTIFGALLQISIRLNGEENAYQDILELGNNEELANEFMEVLKRDIRCRLAKESSSMEE